jgi:hypothetical protein
MRRIAAVMAAVFVACLPAGARADAPGFVTVKLTGADSGTEPRVAVASDDTRWVVTNGAGRAVVYKSAGGALFTSAGAVPGQRSATIDTDIVTTRPVVGTKPRVIASELDTVALSFRTGYTDDGGLTWTPSEGMFPTDSDRQWLAAGPDDPVTGLPRVYLLFHNLLSGEAFHNMWVQTSTDAGATFAMPVPVTLPGDQAWLDLQCADSGGPKGITVNQTTGQIYVLFPTRTAPAGGGCGASVFNEPAINVVFPTRFWVATSMDGTAGSWTQSLAVDGGDKLTETGNGITLDAAGNVYVVHGVSATHTDFTETTKYAWAPPDLSVWTTVDVATDPGLGHVRTHIAAGAPGKVDVAYIKAEPNGSDPPRWFPILAQSLDGGATWTESRLSTFAVAEGTPNELLGDCGTGAARGVQAGFLCNRWADDFGIAVDHAGKAIVTFPTKGTSTSGTFVATQIVGTVVS